MGAVAVVVASKAATRGKKEPELKDFKMGCKVLRRRVGGIPGCNVDLLGYKRFAVGGGEWSVDDMFGTHTGHA